MRRLRNSGFLDSLAALVQDGAYSKAVKHLLSDGVHDAHDAAVRAKLEALHPQREPPQASLHHEAWPWDVNDDAEDKFLRAIRQTMLAFPAGSAAGPSGLRPQHLQDVLMHQAGSAASVTSSLAQFVKMCLDGQLPPAAASFLCSANLLPLRKPGKPGDVRPVAVGETLRRLVGKYVMRTAVAKSVVEGMKPWQCGVSIPGACETVANGLQNWVADNQVSPNWMILQVDLRNAFNCIDRQALLDETSKVAPALAAWATSCYGQHSGPVDQGPRVVKPTRGAARGPFGAIVLCIDVATGRLQSATKPDIQLVVFG